MPKIKYKNEAISIYGTFKQVLKKLKRNRKIADKLWKKYDKQYA